MKGDGTLQILQKWHELSARPGFRAVSPAHRGHPLRRAAGPSHRRPHVFQNAIDFLPILLKGRWSRSRSRHAFVLSSVLGLILALLKVSPNRAVSTVGSTVVNVIRGLPIIVQLFYVLLPDLGIQLSAFQAGVLGLGIAYSAYQAENFRAGIEAIDRGQIEAAHAIGIAGR